MANFCTNCGTKLRKDDNFCTNCGTKIDKSDIKQNNPLLKSAPDSIEKNKAKKELKRVVGGKLLYNETFSEELLRNGLDLIPTGKAIKEQVEKEIDSGQIKSGGVEFRVNQLIQEYKIKKEEEPKITKVKKQTRIKKVKKEPVIAKEKEIEMTHRNYCDLNCIHCHEEFLDSEGSIIGDYTDGGMFDYYCDLGHQVAHGRFCKDYE
ncbi:hypothetical protein TL18_03660 [Methanobrevibacter sp. YE315]|uniref:zinc-ribbon domain-containing protein n=1 Tax=Methanobrevibacter sp. YE315 TaxID=1609968 RepID=UPI000764F21D|nr:zinc ribbon domain-containing protein [Methanobrevibacter sp. YE315]AMD17197.1 hypothetical protein TL18_03660 [Methanobrevibacter sp. YE315]